MRVLVRMYNESVRRVCGLEKATLTRCEGEEEGVGTAVKGKDRVQRTPLMDSPVSCDFRRMINGNTPNNHTRVVNRSVLG